MNKLLRKRIRMVRLETNDNALIKEQLPQYVKSIDDIKDLGFKEGYFVKRVIFTCYSNLSYEQLVNKLIAERYTIQDELAIQRKHQKGVNKAEFEEYDTYVEECKVRAKEFIAEREKTEV